MADNSSRKFKFISPGVFINEIDNSQVPQAPGDIGPVVFGLATKGPMMTPITVNSFSEFVETFGEPTAGNQGDDMWRDNSLQTPTYGSYAAQAWLRNNPTITYVRLGGAQDPEAEVAGYAGWNAGTISSTPSEGGAWGLFAFPSSSLPNTNSTAGVIQAAITGALAATFYVTEGRVGLHGLSASFADTSQSPPAEAIGCSQLFETDADGTFTIAHSTDGTTAAAKKQKVSLNPQDKNFIRKVLNTNPTITNSAITTAATRTSNMGGGFWLGETFEHHLFQRTTFGTVNVTSSNKVLTGSSMGVLGNPANNANILGQKFHVAILPLRNQKTITNVQNDNRYAGTKATTGFFFSQDLGTNARTYDPTTMQKLFRFEALNAGKEIQEKIKISISDIKAPSGDFEKYGTFNVLIRRMSDNDNVRSILERYDNLNLNPASSNYIAAQIGDMYEEYDASTKTNRQYGTFANRSKYIRVVMDEDVDRGSTESEYLPFGVYGPLKYRDVSLVSGSGGFQTFGTVTSGTRGTIASMVDGGPIALFGGDNEHTSWGGNQADAAAQFIMGGLDDLRAFSASIVFPSVPLRETNDWGNPKSKKDTFWGAWVHKSPSDVNQNPSIPDMLRPRASGLESNPASTAHDIADILLSGSTTGEGRLGANQARATTDPLQIAWAFTLDNVSGSGNDLYYVSGSRTTGNSVSAVSSSYTGTLDIGADRFTTVLHGGSDGFDITERNPFRNSLITSTSTEATSYELHSLKRAINLVADPEQVSFNLATMPGVTNSQVTNHLLDTVEDRGDSLAIIDLEKVYDADTESSASAAERNAFTVKQATQALKDRNLNNSYGAAYYPWVKIQDTITNRILWAPPSVVALGALSNTDRVAAPWFAPAGFQRGGLSEGAAGLPVLDTSKRLTSDDRDALYETNINPIAKFPAEGIVIFGQKTLQQTASALDRINVRRLLIFLKREISFIASRLLFQQNTRDTWNVFLGQAKPLLDTVKTEFGIDDFRLILDETTTTPDLIDRNIIYAKLIVKPTRSAEFFAIDFVVTNSGAGFED